MVKLYKLVKKWLSEHPDLNTHFIVAVQSERPLLQPMAAVAVQPMMTLPKEKYYITYKCANTSDWRQQTGQDQLFDIDDLVIKDGSMQLNAGDPNLFVKLERILRRKHDRTGEFNMVKFLNDCKMILHHDKI